MPLWPPPPAGSSPTESQGAVGRAPTRSWPSCAACAACVCPAWPRGSQREAEAEAEAGAGSGRFLFFVLFCTFGTIFAESHVNPGPPFHHQVRDRVAWLAGACAGECRGRIETVRPVLTACPGLRIEARSQDPRMPIPAPHPWLVCRFGNGPTPGSSTTARQSRASRRLRGPGPRTAAEPEPWIAEVGAGPHPTNRNAALRVPSCEGCAERQARRGKRAGPAGLLPSGGGKAALCRPTVLHPSRWAGFSSRPLTRPAAHPPGFVEPAGRDRHAQVAPCQPRPPADCVRPRRPATRAERAGQEAKQAERSP